MNAYEHFAKSFKPDDFITGEKFEALADINLNSRSGWENPPDRSDLINQISAIDKAIIKIFVNTHDLKHILKTISLVEGKRFILICHNSDGEINTIARRPFDHSLKDFQLPANVIALYSQNVDTDFDRIIPIPIGMENAYYFKPLKKLENIYNLMQSQPAKENKLYVCFNIWTNPTERIEPYIGFRDCNYCTVDAGLNGSNFDRYINNMARHRFVLCPDGNGIDTIRMWEALYLGCIPIVKRHAFTKYFEGKLPIIIVDGWGAASEFIMEFVGRNCDIFLDTCNKYEMLTMSYWRDRINKNVD